MVFGGFMVLYSKGLRLCLSRGGTDWIWPKVMTLWFRIGGHRKAKALKQFLAS